MKYYKQLEVILFSSYSCNNPQQKELVRWLGTTLQSTIIRQQRIAKKIFLKKLKDTPAIYMS